MLNVVKLLQQNHVKYGLIMSALIALCLVYMLISGTGFDNKSPIFVFVSFIMPFVVWFFGIRAKKKELKGKLTLKEGITEGFKISLVFGIVSPFVFLIYYLINPSSIDYLRTSYGLSQTAVSMVIIVDMLAQFIAAIVFGTIYGIIISLILKTKK